MTAYTLFSGLKSLQLCKVAFLLVELDGLGSWTGQKEQHFQNVEMMLSINSWESAMDTEYK